jgi:dienelactone hydrolase
MRWNTLSVRSAKTSLLPKCLFFIIIKHNTMFKERGFVVDASGKTQQGVLFVPDDIETNSEPCALVAFNPGIGESKVVSTLYNIGPLAFAKAGNKMTFTDPETKKTVRFFILSMVDPGGWSPSHTAMAYAIRNDVLLKYPQIDKNMVYVTGLSAGGDVTLKGITDPATLGLWAAAVPMSPASVGFAQNADQTVKAGIRTLGFVGNQDGNFTNNLKQWDATLNAVEPGTARSTIYNGGHGGWNTFYDPNYKTTLWSATGMSIYEWMLAAKKGSRYAFAPVPDSSLKAVLLPGNITINSTSLLLDGSQSTGVVKNGDGTFPWNAFQWGYNPVKGNNWGIQMGGGAYGGAQRTMTGLKDGDVVLVSLTVMGIDGKTATTTSTVTVSMAANQAPKVGAGVDVTIQAPLNKVSLDATASDADGKVAVFQWSQVSGPSQANFINPTTEDTVVEGLEAGIYEFKLEVRDDKGAVSSDTVKVTVIPYDMPAPQTGDTVLYYPSSTHDPLAAIVTKVWSEDMVNLTVFNPDNTTGGVTSLRSLPQSEGGNYWKPRK